MTDPRVALRYDRISEGAENVCDVVEFGGGRAIDNDVERYAWAFHHVGILDAVHPLPGVNDSVRKGAWCGTRSGRTENRPWTNWGARTVTVLRKQL